MRPGLSLVEIRLDRQRHLLITFGAMWFYERATGKSLWSEDPWRRASVRDLRALLWAALLHEDPGLTIEQAGRLVGSQDLLHVRGRLVAAWEASLPEADPNNKGGQASVSWDHIWAVGRYDLHLGEAEFWDLTPRQFSALLDRRDADIRQQDHRVALLAATIANTVPRKNGKAFSVDDFMPKEPQKAKPWQQMLAVVELLNAKFGGRDMRKQRAAEQAPEGGSTDGQRAAG